MYQSGLFFNVTAFLVGYDYKKKIERAKPHTRNLGLHMYNQEQGTTVITYSNENHKHLNVRFVHAPWDIPPPSLTLSKT